MVKKLKLTPSADMVQTNLVKVADNLTQAANNLMEKPKVSDTQHVVTDPPLPAGIANPSHATIDSPPNGNNGNGETPETPVEPDTADLPIGQRTNKIAQTVSTYYDKARSLGDTKIKGDNSLIALAEACIDGGRKGVFAQEKDGPNYAQEMFERYMRPNSGLKKSRYVDPTEPVNEQSFTQQVNKLDWFIKLGWHRGDLGYKFYNQVKDIHSEMAARKEDRLTLKYRARYEGILSIIRPYMSDWLEDQSTPMPDESEIRTALRKPEKDDKDAIDYLLGAFREIGSAYEGKRADVKAGRDERKPIKDDRLVQAQELLRDVIQDQGPDAAKRYLDATAVKAKKAGSKKKGNGATAPSTPADDNEQLPDAPVGSEGPGEGDAVAAK
jgi:hypothetical protein